MDARCTRCTRCHLEVPDRVRTCLAPTKVPIFSPRASDESQSHLLYECHGVCTSHIWKG